MCAKLDVLTWLSWAAAVLLVSVPARAQDDDEASPESAEPTSPPLSLQLGGALRFNYLLPSWASAEAIRARGGDVVFDTFRVNADGDSGPLGFSLEYRFYAGFQMLHHGYVAYVPVDDLELQAGVQRVPFGLLPYASNNWFFSLGYYFGLEDDYDLGVKALYRLGPLDLRVAFYATDEGSYFGASSDSARYSYDIVTATDGELDLDGAARTDQEVSQLSVRAAWLVGEGDAAFTELGASARAGGLYNAATGELGHHWAFAAHVAGEYRVHERAALMPQLQLAYVSFAPALPAGEDPRFVVLGAYDAPYRVASRAWRTSRGEWRSRPACSRP